MAHGCREFHIIFVRLAVSLALLLPYSPAKAFGTASIRQTPVVICPGFGNDEIDYVNPLEQGEEAGFVAALVRRGFDPDLIFPMPLKRWEWVRVAGGLLDVPDFYRGTARPDGTGYGWYLKRLRRTVNNAYDAGGQQGKVLLIGHSAGGWLARASLGDGSWDDESASSRISDRVCALVTLGAIHRPPAGNALGTCVTRGALAYVDKQYPGAYLANDGIAYVSVGGDAVLGQPNGAREAMAASKEGSRDANAVYKFRGEGSASSVAYTSYEAVSGTGDLTGDGVVPLDWTILNESRAIVLDGVLHSINEAGTTIPTDRWYGSDGVIDRWLGPALEEARITPEKKIKSSDVFVGLSFLEKILGVSNQDGSK